MTSWGCPWATIFPASSIMTSSPRANTSSPLWGPAGTAPADGWAPPSRDLRRPPFAQVIDAEHPKHLAATPLPLRRAQRAKAVSDVLFSGQVRKERQILMYVSDAPFPGCDVSLFLRVVQLFAADGNAPFV